MCLTTPSVPPDSRSGDSLEWDYGKMRHGKMSTVRPLLLKILVDMVTDVHVLILMLTYTVQRNQEGMRKTNFFQLLSGVCRPGFDSGQTFVFLIPSSFLRHA